MKKILFILFIGLGFCQNIDNQYNVTYINNDKTIIIEDVIYIDKTLLTVIFKDSYSKKSYEIKKSKIINIINSKNNRIVSFKELNNNVILYNYPPRDSIQKSINYSSGDLIQRSGNLMLVGDILPIVGLTIVEASPQLTMFIGLVSYLIKLRSYVELMKAGIKLDEEINEHSLSLDGKIEKEIYND